METTVLREGYVVALHVGSGVGSEPAAGVKSDTIFWKVRGT